MKRFDGDYLPAEVHQIIALRPWWYTLAGILLVASGLGVAGVLSGQIAGWLAWVSNAFTAAQVTLSLFLVILTYNLFAAATRVTEQNERIHRISQLPIVVAEIEPLAFEPYPSYQLRIMNEGSGPALDISIEFDYRLKTESSADRALAASADVRSDARLRIGVINKASHTGLLQVDARGIMLANPWKGKAAPGTAEPTRAETEALLAPYSLVVSIRYKDIYSQEGRTRYEAFHAAGDAGIELIELVAPSVTLGSSVKPIVFAREPERT